MVSSAGPLTSYRSTQKITTTCIRHTESFSILLATMLASTTIKTWLTLSSSEKMHRNSQLHALPNHQSNPWCVRRSQWVPLSSVKLAKEMWRIKVSSLREEALSLQIRSQCLADRSTIHLSSYKRSLETNSEMNKSSNKLSKLIRVYLFSANNLLNLWISTTITVDETNPSVWL